MATGNIAISSTAQPITYQEWVNKNQWSIKDETPEQFQQDLAEALVKVRRECFYFCRENRIWKQSDNRAFLPQKWITDGNFSGSITTDDFFVYQLDTNGWALEAVDASNIESIDAFNNYITLSSSFTPTRQMYITYYAMGKPFDEVKDEELKYAIMSKVSLIILERLMSQRNLKGVSSWSAAGVSVSKDNQTYETLHEKKETEYNSYKNFLKPTVMRNIMTGKGFAGNPYDPNIAYSDQVLSASRLRRFRK